MRNSVSGNWQAFWKTDTTADYEIRYSYYNEDTDASGSHGFLHARWLSAGSRLVINMIPGYVRLREYDGSSWTTRGTGWVTTEEATWYEVHAKLNGSNVEVWWGEKGGALSMIIDTSSVSLTTTERFRFEVAPAAQFRYDDITIFSDGVKSTTTFTNNDANEQTAMTVDGTTTNFAYDAWGRLTSRTRGALEAEYAWRYGSFLANVTSDFPGEASEVDYVYDGLSNRRLKLVDGTDYTWTRYDANGSALADYSNGTGYWDIGGRQRSFHGAAEIAGSSPQTGTPSYYLRNHLGSIMATTDASKDIVASYQYTPYGEFLSESTTGDHTTFGYTGHRLDRELNHYYAKYRYYNPTTMRWLSRDPLGMVDGPNVYAYVRGNVVNAVDPDGLSCIMIEYPDGSTSGCISWFRNPIKRWKLGSCQKEYQKDQLECVKKNKPKCPEPSTWPSPDTIPPKTLHDLTSDRQKAHGWHLLEHGKVEHYGWVDKSLNYNIYTCMEKARRDYYDCIGNALGLY